MTAGRLWQLDSTASCLQNLFSIDGRAQTYTITANQTHKTCLQRPVDRARMRRAMVAAKYARAVCAREW